MERQLAPTAPFAKQLRAPAAGAGLGTSPADRRPPAEAGRNGAAGEGLPGDSAILKRQGDALAQREQYAEAEVLYRRALAAAPDFAEVHNNLGNALSFLGRGEEAAACYRRALEFKPSLTDAHNNLGAWLAQRGLREPAMHHLRQVLRADPSHANAHLNLAKLLVELGDRSTAAEHFHLAAGSSGASAEIQTQCSLGLIVCQQPGAAIDLLERLVEREPLNAAAYRALSAAYASQRRVAPATFHARQAVELEPRNGLAHSELALLLKEQGRMMDALFHARLGINLSPKLGRPHLNMGSILEAQGKTEEALKAYREAIRLDPNLPEAHSNYGVLLLSTDNAQAALAALRRAAELSPHSAAIQSNLGIGLQEIGSFEEARACFEWAVAIEPTFAEGLCNLAMIEQQFGRMSEARRLYQKAVDLRPDVTAAVLGLVQVSTDKKNAISVESVESMLADPTLNRTAKRDLHFALAKIHDEAGEAEPAFLHAREAHREERYPDKADEQPAEELARRTMRVFSSEFFANRPGFGRRSELPVFVVGLPRTGTTLVEQILSSHPRIFGAGELMDLPRLSQRWGRMARISEPFPEGARQLDEPACLRLAGIYLQALRQFGGNAERVIDKLPFNFWRIGLISLLFPKARIINCRRNPLDVFTSGYFMRFRHPMRHMSDQGAFAEYFIAYARLMDHWRKVAPNPILDVDYEDLVDQQEPISRRIVEFCGMPWDRACLEFYRNPRPVRTGSAAQVRRSIYAGSVGRWRRYSQQLQPLIATLASAEELPSWEKAVMKAAAI